MQVNYAFPCLFYTNIEKMLMIYSMRRIKSLQKLKKKKRLRIWSNFFCNGFYYFNTTKSWSLHFVTCRSRLKIFLKNNLFEQTWSLARQNNKCLLSTAALNHLKHLFTPFKIIVLKNKNIQHLTLTQVKLTSKKKKY
jgi:hypothetical protein